MSSECSICQRRYEGHGNNAWPITDARCCDDCDHQVVAVRLLQAQGVTFDFRDLALIRAVTETATRLRDMSAQLAAQAVNP